MVTIDLELLQKKISLIKEGVCTILAKEKQAFFVLTATHIFLIFFYNHRTELFEAFENKGLIQIVRIANQGVFSGLQLCYANGQTVFFRFDSEDSQREVSRKLVRMSNIL